MGVRGVMRNLLNSEQSYQLRERGETLPKAHDPDMVSVLAADSDPEQSHEPVPKQGLAPWCPTLAQD